MVKAIATIIIVLILFSCLACEARVLRTSPDRTSVETTFHKDDEKHQQQQHVQKRPWRSDDPRSIEAMINFFESHETFAYSRDESIMRMQRFDRIPFQSLF